MGLRSSKISPSLEQQLMPAPEVEAYERELAAEFGEQDPQKLRELAEAKYIDILADSLYPEVRDEMKGGWRLPTADEREQSQKRRQDALKVLAWICSTAADLPLPYGASLLFQGLGAVFNQFRTESEVADDVVALFIDLALLLEILGTLERNNGFSDRNQAFWRRAAGKLHMAVLNRAVAGAKEVCFSLQRQGAIKSLALARENKEDVSEASEKLDRARRHFVESITARKVLSDDAVEAVEYVCKRQEGTLRVK